MGVPVIALVEDDPATLDMLDELLTGVGYKTIPWPRGKDAHLMIRTQRPDLVILDMCLEDPEAGGMVLGLMEIDPATREIPVIICSAHVMALRERHARLLEKDYPVLQKPFPTLDLLEKVASLLEVETR